MGSLNTDEQQLFMLIAQGDEEAYTRVFHLFTPRLMPFLMKITKDENLARELLQETFLRLWANKKSLFEVKQPDSWLFRIAANCCFTYLRVQATHDRLQSKVIEAQPTGAYSSAIDQLEAKEMEQILHEAVSALPPKRQEIYRLSREQGLSHQEIANRLGLSLSTVKNQLGISLKFIHVFLQRKTGLSMATLAILFCR